MVGESEGMSRVMWGGYEDPEEEEKAAAAAVVVACASRASRARSRPRLEEPSGWWVVKAVLVVVQRAAADGRPRASDAARARSRAADAIAILRSGVQVWEAPPQAGAEKGEDGACLSIGFVFFLVFLRAPPPCSWEKKMARYFLFWMDFFKERIYFSRKLLAHFSITSSTLARISIPVPPQTSWSPRSTSQGLSPDPTSLTLSKPMRS